MREHRGALIIAAPVCRWILTLVAALIAAVLAPLTAQVPEAIAITAADAHKTYAYDGHHLADVWTVDDRAWAPRGVHGRTTNYDSGDRWSHGPSARQTTPRTLPVSTYGHPSLHVPDAGVAPTGHGAIMRATGALASVAGSVVAAKPVPDPAPVLRASGAADRSSAVHISVRRADGTIETHGSRLGGIHAEDVAQGLEPGGQMSRPFGWRRDSGTGERTWQPINVCRQCQSKYPPSLFPRGTGADPGGAWGQ